MKREKREVLAIETMLEESKESYAQLFEKLKERGLKSPSLNVSDAHKGLVAAIREAFPGASWHSGARYTSCGTSRCMYRTGRKHFAGLLKGI